MGGGRDFAGNIIYRRRNGVYERLDGRPLSHRQSLFDIKKLITTVDSSYHQSMVSPSVRAAMTPLPDNGSEVSQFFQNTMALDDLNDRTSGSYISKKKRTDGQLYQKLINGRFDTENGGLLFQSERDKNEAYLKHNDLPSYKEVLNQVVPQLTPQNLKQVMPSHLITVVDGKRESPKLWVYETFVTNKRGQSIRTYVKVMPMHSNSGKPYTILVSLHRTGPIQETATRLEKGL